MEICSKCNQSDKIRVYKKGVNCLCDLDNCEGQRCGAKDIIKSYYCDRCNYEFISEEYKNYREYHNNRE